jgi:hypothetical protein
LADGSVESLTQGKGESLEQAYLRIISQDVAPVDVSSEKNV